MNPWSPIRRGRPGVCSTSSTSPGTTAVSSSTSKNVARTISRDQVSRPMYTTSKGRWRNYEKHLEPIFGILEDYL